MCENTRILDMISNWLYENSAAIIISSVFSLIISKVFYDKSNRDALLINVINPIMLCLKEEYSRENYQKIFDIASIYSARYLKKRERNALIALLHRYEEVCKYKRNYIDTKSIISYFLKKTEESGVDIKNYPIYDDNGNEGASGYPPNFHYLELDIDAIVSEDLFGLNPNDYETQLSNILKNYAKKLYNAKDEIIYFDDMTVKKIINSSGETKEWNEKFKEMDKRKQIFLNLPVCKKISKILKNNKL